MNYRIDQLRYQLREDPSSRVFNQLAELLRREGEAEEAVAILRRGLEVHPRYAAAWVVLGRALSDIQDSAGAVEAFARAHTLDTGNVEAARAVADAAFADERWSDAVEILTALGDAAPGDDDVAAKLADAEKQIADEMAAEEARAARAIPVPRPPAEVIILSAEDPFADEIGASDDWAATQADVFAAADPPRAEIEVEAVVADELFDEVAAGGDAEDDPVGLDGSAVEPALDGPFGEEPFAEDEDEDEFESWADMEDDDGGALLRVEPPAAVDHDVPGEEKSPAEEVMIDADFEDDLPVPEIAEPDLDPVPVAAEEPEFESWADMRNDDDAVEPTEADSEIATFDASVEPALAEADSGEDSVDQPPEVVDVTEPPLVPEAIADFDISSREFEDESVPTDAGAKAAFEAVDDAEEVLIPEAIAHFDRPSEDEDDESGSVTASDVPLPTLTLAKLALEQGDKGLARATLERLIEQNPSNAEASEMLRGLQSGSGADQIDVTGAKVAALRGWLDTIRLASERHST